MAAPNDKIFIDISNQDIEMTNNDESTDSDAPQSPLIYGKQNHSNNIHIENNHMRKRRKRQKLKPSCNAREIHGHGPPQYKKQNNKLNAIKDENNGNIKNNQHNINSNGKCELDDEVESLCEEHKPLRRRKIKRRCNVNNNRKMNNNNDNNNEHNIFEDILPQMHEVSVDHGNINSDIGCNDNHQAVPN